MLLIRSSVRKRKWVFDAAKISGFCLIPDWTDGAEDKIRYFLTVN